MARTATLEAYEARQGLIVVLEQDVASRPSPSSTPVGVARQEIPLAWIDALLRYTGFARAAPEDLAGIWSSRSDGGEHWFALGSWMQLARLRRGDPSRVRLRGATLVFPRSNVSHVLKRRVIAALRRFGVSRLIFLSPEVGEASDLHLQIVADRPVLATARLWFRRLGHWHRLQCAALPDGALRREAAMPSTDAPRRHVVFEGLSQMLEATREAAPLQRGRFLVRGGACVFQPMRRRLWPPRVHWIVERNARNERLLQFVAVQGMAPPTLAEVAARLAAADDVLLASQLGPAGAERQWCYLARGLKALGFDVTFAVHEALEGVTAQYGDLLAEVGIVPISLADGVGSDAFGLTTRYPALLHAHCATDNPFGGTLAALTWLVDAIRPHAVIAQNDTANTLAGIAGQICRTPRIVLSSRNVSPRHLGDLPSERYRPSYQALVGSRRIVWTANSVAGARDYAAWLGLREADFAIVRNGIDAQRFGPDEGERAARIRRELGIAASAPVILGVFRLSEEKDPLLFLEVCARVAASVPWLHVLICGVGPMHAAIERRAAALGLSRCRLLGQRADIADVLCAATLVLHTARHEGMPNAIMEAQATGLAVVATRAGDVAEIVSDGETGLLSGTGDLPALTQNCGRLLTDQALRRRMGAAGAERMRRLFSLDRMVRGYAAMIAAPAAIAAASLGEK
jgi:glycosyltransferase involved in cell wall biosynthesis